MTCAYDGDIYIWSESNGLIHTGSAGAYVETIEDAFAVMEEEGIDRAEVMVWNDADQMYEFSEWLELHER